MINQCQWSQHADIRDWLKRSRLDGFTVQSRSANDDPARGAVMDRIKAASPSAFAKLTEFLQ